MSSLSREEVVSAGWVPESCSSRAYSSSPSAIVAPALEAARLTWSPWAMSSSEAMLLLLFLVLLLILLLSCCLSLQLLLLLGKLVQLCLHRVITSIGRGRFRDRARTKLLAAEESVYRIQGSPTSSYCSGLPLITLRGRLTASTMAGITMQAGPQPSGALASKRTAERVRPATKIQHVKKRGVGPVAYTTLLGRRDRTGRGRAIECPHRSFLATSHAVVLSIDAMRIAYLVGEPPSTKMLLLLRIAVCWRVLQVFQANGATVSPKSRHHGPGVRPIRRTLQNAARTNRMFPTPPPT